MEVRMEQTLREKCLRHWQRLRIIDRDTLTAAIDKVFETNTTQSEALVDMYKLVLPEWDLIEKINGFPEAGHKLWKYICRRFIEFDHKHHPNVFNGGIWLNTGFTSNSELGDWEIRFDNCTVEYIRESA